MKKTAINGIIVQLKIRLWSTVGESMTESEFQEFIITIGYRYNEKSKTAFNSFEGFHAMIRFHSDENRYILSMSAGAIGASEAASVSAQIKDFHTAHKNYVIKSGYSKKTVQLVLKMTVDSEIDKEELKALAKFIIELCKSGKIVPICKVCSRKRDTGLYVVGRTLTPICDKCIVRKRRQYEHRKNLFIKKKQNMPAGLFGAVFGAVLGSMLYILLYQFLPNFGVGSAMIVALSFGGFVVTGSRATKKSAVICTVLSILIFVAAEYLALVTNMAILIEHAGGGIAVSEAIQSTNDSLINNGYIFPVLLDLGIGVVVMVAVGVLYFLKRKYTRPLKISKNVL